MLTEYRSLVGKLLYYTTKIGPEMSNAVRDLSSHMSNPGPEHWKALERCVGYLTSMEKDLQGLVFRRPRTLRSISYADSDYAKCEDSRKSISGMINTLGGMLSNWRSGKQDIVALSSSEAEYIAYCICCQETLYMYYLLMELLWWDIEPGLIYEDNQGCIFLIKNQTIGQRTKHIDVRYHFSREKYEAGLVEPRFCRSENQYADGMTKNQPDALFRKHRDNIRLGNLEVQKEDVETDRDRRHDDDYEDSKMSARTKDARKKIEERHVRWTEP